MNRWLALIGTFFCMGGLCSLDTEEVAAGTAVRMDVSDLVEHADLVFEGRVLSQTVVQAENGRIDTEYLVSVDRTFWGEDAPLREVRMPGGVLPDGRGMLVPGLSRLSPGEDVMLMLSAPASDGLRLPIGLAQGKFRLLTERSGSKSAVRAQADLTLAQGATGRLKEADGLFVMDYAELVGEVERAVARKRAGAGAPGLSNGR